MGCCCSCCFRSSNKKIWKDDDVIQAWFPMLENLFKYDLQTKDIIGINITDININGKNVSDSYIVQDQIRTLPILLKGKSGVNKQLLTRLKNLKDKQYIDNELIEEKKSNNPDEIQIIEEPSEPKIIHNFI